MKSTRTCYLIYLFASLIIWQSAIYEVKAQDSTVDSRVLKKNFPHVEWVRNWPSAESKHHTGNFKEQLNSVLFGIHTPELMTPVSILANKPEELWILDQGNRTVFHVLKDVGDIPHPIKKSGLDLSSLVGICLGPNSSILFTDSKAGKIYQIVPGKKNLQVLNDSLYLEQPTGITYSAAAGEIWVLETKAHRIAILNEKGEIIKRTGSRGTAPGEFNFPTHIWADKKGHIYITDAMNFRIQLLDREGKDISVFGEAGDATGYMARPKGVATDSFGNIYVVDALFNAVQIFDDKGTFLYKFGVQGHGNSEFWMPSGIFIDENDTIYVADSYNSRVQVFQLIHSDRQ